MEDLKFSYHDPIVIGKDMAAAQTIAHAGNVHHIATKTAALHDQVRFGHMIIEIVSSSKNLGDGQRFNDTYHHSATMQADLANRYLSFFQ